MYSTIAGIILASLASCALQAQSTAPSVTELHKASWGYEATKANLVKAAEKFRMPNTPIAPILASAPSPSCSAT